MSTHDSSESWDNWHWLAGGTVIVVTLIIAALILLAALHKTHTSASETGYNGPNAVANGLASAGDQLSRTFSITGQAFSHSGQTVASTASHSAQAVSDGAADIGHDISVALAWSGTMATRVVYRSIATVFYIPNHVISYTADSAVVSAVIKPSQHTSLPVISPVVLASKPIAAPKPAAVINTTTIWPIHGDITTLFGVPELPYQAIHTGLDISDGKAAGTTPVHPFSAGRVSQVIRGNTGLGNHVVVDHGNGLTSVYGHLNSIAVNVGQVVGQSDVLGFEGTTGVSTGTHLHFEIRVDGIPHDPHGFITGQP